MNTKHIIIAAAAVAALFTGCAKNIIEKKDNQNALKNLELVAVSSRETKAALDGTTFPQDGHIGLFLFKEEKAETLYADGCANVDYSYSSQKGKWTADPSIKVGGETGYLYGYYPYSSENGKNIKAIPVKSTLNGDDVMYATKQTVTSQNADQATITMNHALARVSITVKNNGYIGNAKLSSIKFEDAKTSVSGTLDATSGSITATKADVTLAVPSGNQTITSDGTLFECLLVPSEKDENKQDVTLTLTIDGQVKTVTLKDDNGVIIARNTKSNITLTLSNSGLSVSSVSIDDWNVVEVGGHKVTVKRSNEDGIANDVFLDVTSNGSTVTIKSHSALTCRRANCTCTPAGKATCTSSIDETTGICTFSISNVQEDITAEVGYLKCNATVVFDSDMGAVKLNGATVDSRNPVQIFCGEEAEFTAEAATGCRFLKWTDGSDKDLSTDNPYAISNVTSDITLKAVFGCEIAAVAKPVGAGTVTGAGFYSKGSNITLTATAGGSFAEFIGWVNKSAPNDTTKTASINIEVTGDASYVAVFSLRGVLSGVFTVAADVQGNPTKKVFFSKGNLWYGKVGDASEATFNFEANQYDTTPLSDGIRDENHISHFMWCDNATNAMTLNYDNNWNGKNKSFFAAKNFTVNGISGWRALTGGNGGEWEYLLDKRNTAYGENHRYAAVKVNGMAGLLIFPDDFSSWPSGAGDEPQTFNGASETWNRMNYTVAEFTVLQNNGCVFLPAAGFRSGNDGDASVRGVGNYGYYWSASPHNNNIASDMYFLSDRVDSDDGNERFLAQSVRLVTEVK